MQNNGPTFRRPPTVPEREFPPGTIVGSELRVWAQSRWRGARELAQFFLASVFRHLPPGTPPMFRLEGHYDGQSGNNNHVIGLYVHFTNPYDAYHLLGQAFWCGCEFIAFTVYNIDTDFHRIFHSPGYMHTLPYACQLMGDE